MGGTTVPISQVYTRALQATRCGRASRSSVWLSSMPTGPTVLYKVSRLLPSRAAYTMMVFDCKRLLLLSANLKGSGPVGFR